MFDVKESDFFDLEDEAFDTVIEAGIKFTGNIKFVKLMVKSMLLAIWLLTRVQK